MPRAKQTSFIEARSIGQARGEGLLFKELDLSLQAGGALRIVGENGSGKTTLLKILCGLLQPDAGRVKVTARHFLGHKNALAEELTVEEMLGWYQCVLPAASCADFAPAALTINEATTRFGLTPDLPCGKLSAGQAKLCCLAKLLVIPRPLWILDEPFVALAPPRQEIVCTMFDQHRRAGGGIIYSDHSDCYPNADAFILAEFR